MEREIQGLTYNVIKKLNSEKCFKFALDIPSGLDANTGKVLGICFQADATATFGGVKIGMELKDGPTYCGEIRVCYISAPIQLY